MRTSVLTAFFVTVIVIVFTSASPLVTLMPNMDAAIAQQPATTDKPVLAQDTPKEAIPAALPEKKGIDPTSIVGEWRGEWASSGALRDSFYLTIKSVQEGRVVGNIRINSRARYANRDLPISGSVTPNTLSLANEYISLSITLVSPDKMEGKGMAETYPITVKLGKSK